MKIDRVKATIRYSQDTGKGAWKAVEIGAEAEIAPGSAWQGEVATLYADLSSKLRQLWQAGERQIPKPGTVPRNGAAPGQIPPIPSNGERERGAHWCMEHQTEFRRFGKDGRVWYSHRTAEGKWCQQKEQT
jgi:hypothetical protein